METRGRIEGKVHFVAVGHLAVDIRGGRPALGGAAAFSALTAMRLGLSVALLTAVGEEFDGFEPLDGTEIYFHRGGTSTTFENIYEGATRRQRLLGQAPPLGEEDLNIIETRLTEDAIVLFCPIAGEVRAPLRRLAARGLCGVAPQGFFRCWDRDGWVRPTPWEDVTEQLSSVDVISLSVEDPPVPDHFRAQVVDKVRVLAMTQGDQGAHVYFGGRGYSLPAFPCQAVDATGAGDVFAAGLLIALREGVAPLEAAQFATCAASFAVETEGVNGLPPDRVSLEHRLKKYRGEFQPVEIRS